MAEVCYRFNKNLLVNGGTANVIMDRLNERGYGVRFYSETRRGSPSGIKISTSESGRGVLRGIDKAFLEVATEMRIARTSYRRTKFKR